MLRIIGGEWRGRKVGFPPVAAIRPTPDRVRETLFNWLQFDIPGSRCLDLFAGSGALGLEALSRGAAEVVFVESDAQAAGRLAGNLRMLACDRGTVVRTPAQQYLEGPVVPFDVIFLDPPYAERLLAATCRRIEERGWLKPGGHVYLEDAAAAGAPELPPHWTLHRSKRAGEVGYHLARRE
ncbi:MAG: 16S rRNA (guanine(966)-N(2))-methyltransferase RsmD [Steroidobacteraceae bacterium]